MHKTEVTNGIEQYADVVKKYYLAYRNLLSSLSVIYLGIFHHSDVICNSKGATSCRSNIIY